MMQPALRAFPAVNRSHRFPGCFALILSGVDSSRTYTERRLNLKAAEVKDPSGLIQESDVTALQRTAGADSEQSSTSRSIPRRQRLY